jgi:hypothetical protein
MRITRRLSIRSPCFVLLPALPARFVQEGQITFRSASGPRGEECELRLIPGPACLASYENIQLKPVAK